MNTRHQSVTGQEDKNPSAKGNRTMRQATTKKGAASTKQQENTNKQATRSKAPKRRQPTGNEQRTAKQRKTTKVNKEQGGWINVFFVFYFLSLFFCIVTCEILHDTAGLNGTCVILSTDLQTELLEWVDKQKARKIGPLSKEEAKTLKEGIVEDDLLPGQDHFSTETKAADYIKLCLRRDEDRETRAGVYAQRLLKYFSQCYGTSAKCWKCPICSYALKV